MNVLSRRHPASPALSDSELTHLAQSALTWNCELFPSGVRASAAAGWLTLSGEVLWNYQRRDAAECMRYLPGLVGVSNDITLRPACPAGARLKDAP
ncbi:osmotically-inducible protein OsmY [Pelomonas saccharophila]|uniref:Osmotically-inducible protein OsmY n=1 Tax=Roseateles saccharophilus TaxID=304 RepID=A0ABU1YLL7_ROSSA|nr:BON domain-containing protein [Roseateles saccharophilus]MDR7269745.1 osmotically-inducible protein OsmY [Roseateles saccharophilus]